MRARIGSLLLVRVEFTVAVAKLLAPVAPLALSVDARLSESHFCMSTSAIYGPSFTSASGRIALMMQVIMLTWPMPREVASSTWLCCGSVA
jgi:hypothetical protein